MKKQVILIIEDDPDILELTQYNLEKEGFAIETAEDGELGLSKALSSQPDLILLDIMLPGIDGLNVCKKLRSFDETKNIPIIMLTAKGEESDICVGLELGADDYLSKPFSPKELVARIRAIIRRSSVKQDDNPMLKIGPLQIDSARHEVRLRDDPLSLTLAEFKILKMLASKPGRVFTRDTLLECIGGGDTYLVDRNIDVHIRALRKKLDTDSDLIVTIRGVGYKCRG